ncbi:G10 protein [Macrophomina phaseolina MS6]|uniref:G10 protein n=2 Tax=Macrophomina phaseolina TaxID=35725 RepID=K2SG70_MACPH|nr:G10 protein [Macrophomina phaseolina MS6]KAH7038840.1 G10 protein [Macrophomina phaseolina]
MPVVRTSKGYGRKKAPPEGYEDIEDTLLEYDNAMKDALNASHEGKKRQEMQWPIFEITHKRSRYIWDLYNDGKISRPLYDWCLKNGKADANLIAKWKKQGYENLCCLRCIQTKETNFQSTCICRVPRDQLKEDHVIQCVSCGCAGCASCD